MNQAMKTDTVRERGFARYARAELPITADEADLREITAAFADLPPDPYAPGTNRFRRYCNAVYLPWNGELHWLPAHDGMSDYYQDDHNPEYPSMVRAFPDVPDQLRRNPLLGALVRSDVERLLWLDELTRWPIWAGVHMIKLAVRDADEVAVSSPNCLHQDGGSTATFTYAHLVDCTNIAGGENVIATPRSAGRQPDEVPGEVHARFTLTEPLETYVVHDHRVSHYVGPVRRGDGPGPGQRCILIVGIAPYAPRL
ncbi:2OG-Fe dioxygenase family protein [Actinokineospora sp. NPDC004072]